MAESTEERLGRNDVEEEVRVIVQNHDWNPWSLGREVKRLDAQAEGQGANIDGLQQELAASNKRVEDLKAALKAQEYNHQVQRDAGRERVCKLEGDNQNLEEERDTLREMVNKAQDEREELKFVLSNTAAERDAQREEVRLCRESIRDHISAGDELHKTINALRNQKIIDHKMIPGTLAVDEEGASDTTEEVYWDEVLSKIIARTERVCSPLTGIGDPEMKGPIFLEFLHQHHERMKNVPLGDSWYDRPRVDLEREDDSDK